MNGQPQALSKIINNILTLWNVRMLELGAEDRIIALLRAADRPLALAEISQGIGRSPPATHRQLQKLSEEGLIERRGVQHDARYSLADSIRVTWTKAPTPRENAIAIRWSRQGGPDWRFPLASRVADEWGYVALIRFLERCCETGIFTPWLRDYVNIQHDGHNLTWANLPPVERSRRLQDPANHGRVHVYAYGSCVVGKPRPDSDLDLVVVHDLTQESVPDFAYKSQVDAIVGPLNLGSPRRLDVHVFAEDEFFQGLVDMHERVRKSILETGITVYSNAREPRYLEAARANLEVAILEWMNKRT